MHEWVQIGLRSCVAVAALFIFTKMMGRKELAQMSIFDYAVGISIGSIGAQMAFDLEEAWYDFLIVLVVYVGVHYLITLATMKSLWARKFFEGAPIILMEDGKIIEKNLRRVHYDINTFLEECRLAGYFDVGQVHTAIMEISGKVSFIKKANNPHDQTYLVANLIIDGKLMKNNIKAMHKDEAWLEKVLKKQGKKAEEVLLATYTHDHIFTLYLKQEPIQIEHILE